MMIQSAIDHLHRHRALWALAAAGALAATVGWQYWSGTYWVAMMGESPRLATEWEAAQALIGLATAALLVGLVIGASAAWRGLAATADRRARARYNQVERRAQEREQAARAAETKAQELRDTIREQGLAEIEEAQQAARAAEARANRAEARLASKEKRRHDAAGAAGRMRRRKEPDS